MYSFNPRLSIFCTSSTGTLYSFCRSIFIIATITTNTGSKILKARTDALMIATVVSSILVFLGLALFFGVMPQGKAESFYGNNDIREYYDKQWDMPDTISDGQELVFAGCPVEKSELWRCKYITYRNLRYMPKKKAVAFLLSHFDRWKQRPKFFVPYDTKFIMHARRYVEDYPRHFLSNGQADAEENHNRNRGFNAVAPVEEAGARPSAVDEKKGNIVDNLEAVVRELREEMEASRRSELRQLMQRRASQALLTDLSSESGLKAPNELGNGYRNYNELGNGYSEEVSRMVQKGCVDLGELQAMVENAAGVNHIGVAQRPRDLELLLLVARVLGKGEYRVDSILFSAVVSSPCIFFLLSCLRLTQNLSVLLPPPLLPLLLPPFQTGSKHSQAQKGVGGSNPPRVGRARPLVL